MCQITSNVGQNIVEFERIKKKVQNRTLPHFHQNDDSAIARGFIEHSYMEGLTATELFFHTMAGRQGIIDTVVKTSETGYISRKFVKALEDIMVKYDGTIRSANNVMVQLLFGDNNCDQTKQVLLKLKSLSMDDKSIEKIYGNHIISYRDEMRIIQRKTMYNYIILEDTFFSPVNFPLLIDNYKSSHKSDLSEKYVLDNIKELLKNTILINNKRDNETFKFLFTYFIYEFLSPKRVIDEYKINKKDFDSLTKDIIKNFNGSQVEPGEMIGMITAQSLGEPSTQMSLTYDTKVFVLIQNDDEYQVYCDSIGKLIDITIRDYPQYTKNNIVDLTKISKKYITVSVNKHEKVHWNVISHFSKHPTNGKLIRIKTKNKEVKGTLSHSFLRKNNITIEKVRGDQLKVGDYIPVCKNLKNLELYNEDINIYFIGNIIKNSIIEDDKLIINRSDEMITFLKQKCKKIILKTNTIEIHNKELCDSYREYMFNIPSEIFLLKNDKLKKLLNIIINDKETIFNNSTITQQIRFLLCYMGIASDFNNNTLILDDYNLNKLKDIDSDNKEIVPNNEEIMKELYKIKPNNGENKKVDLINYIKDMPKDNALVKVLKQNIYSDVIYEEILELEIYNDHNEEFVYDFTVPGNETFICLNGILVHNTLNTFHSTGSASVGMQGVPRIRELISCTANIKTPMMIIYLNNINDKINNVASNLKYTLFKEIIRKTEIIFHNSKYKDITNPITLSGKDTDETKLPWIIRVVLDKNQLMLNEMNLLFIKTQFINYWINVSTNLKGIKTDEKDIINNVVDIMILSNFDNDNTPELHIRLELSEYDYNKIINLHNMIINNFVLTGIKNISKISEIKEESLITFDEKTGEMSHKKEKLIFTEGVNLLDIRYYKYIDLNKTITNDIIAIYNTFGIEGARTALIKEIYNVFKSGGSEVNYHHIELLVDVMTNTGYLTSIDRHGINRLDTDPLSRASFEKTMDHLVNAAVFGESDHMRSVSSTIMTGQPIKGGTGMSEILIDHKMILDSEVTIEDTNIEKVLIDNPLINDIIENEDIDIFIP